MVKIEVYFHPYFCTVFPWLLASFVQNFQARNEISRYERLSIYALKNLRICIMKTHPPAICC
jgi:hypothetical protein